jgi:methylase of polypeptide subunit release factors
VAEAVRGRLTEVGYTTVRLEETLGGGRISFSPADAAVHERRLVPGDPFSALVRLFLLGLAVDADQAQAALGPVDAGMLADTGWLEEVVGGLRATLKLVPHGELLIASDRETEGPTGADWVAGIHPPSVTLAKLTVRLPVARALDVATGNGIQALLAAHHAEAVVATDVNPRALELAALNVRLNGLSNVELREGSYFEPVEGERFGLVTCNPPYVISPESRYAYRDSGLRGDTVSRRVVEQASAALDEGGFAHILVSWAHRAGDRWGSLEEWVAGSGCDAWLLHFGSDDPVSHAAEWLRPVAREDPDEFRERLDEWLDYLHGLGAEAIAHGAVILRRRSGGRNWTRKDRVSLERLEQAGGHVLRVFEAQDYLETLADDRGLLDERLALVEAHRLEQTFAGAELRSTTLSLREGLGFRVGLDEHAAGVVPLLEGERPLRAVLAQRATELGLASEDAVRFEQAALPAVRRLLELGIAIRA